MFPPLTIFMANGVRKSLFTARVRLVGEIAVEPHGQRQVALEEERRIAGVDRRPGRLLVGNPVAVVHELLAEGFEAGDGGVADFAGISVLAGEGRDGRGGLGEGEQGDKDCDERFFHRITSPFNRRS